LVEKARDRSSQDFPCTEKEKACHNHGGKDFVFTMPIRVVGIWRPGGGGDSDEGDHAGGTIEEGVHRIGKNAQTAEPPTDPKLKACEKNVANESGQ
jgi:hypothetical protein